MRAFSLTDDQITAVRGALELAGEKYRANSAELAKIAGHERLVEQFDRQADQTAALLDVIDY